MSGPIYLTEQEIKGVTGKTWRHAQAQALAQMGIDFRQRPDGSLLVSRQAYELALGGAAPAADDRALEPDFSAMR